MSIQCIRRVIEQSKARGHSRLLLLVIAERADDSGFAYPGLDYLQHGAAMCRQAVVNNIVALESSGNLFVDRRHGGCNNRYIVLAGLTDYQVSELLTGDKFQLPVEEAHAALESIRVAKSTGQTQRSGNKSIGQTQAECADRPCTESIGQTQAEQGTAESTGQTQKERGAESIRDESRVYAIDPLSLCDRPDPSLIPNDPPLDSKESPDGDSLPQTGLGGSSPPIPDPPTPKTQPVQPHIALIDAYLEALETIGRKPVEADHYKRRVRIATAMQKASITPEQVRTFVLDIYAHDAWWREKTKPVPLETVAEQLPSWLSRERDGPPAPVKQGTVPGRTIEGAVVSGGPRNFWKRAHENFLRGQHEYSSSKDDHPGSERKAGGSQCGEDGAAQCRGGGGSAGIDLADAGLIRPGAERTS